MSQTEEYPCCAMDRRQFLTTLGAGAGAGGGKAVTLRGEGPAPRATKNWAWLRGGIGSMDEWRRSLARMKRFGIDAVLISGPAEFYRRGGPPPPPRGGRARRPALHERR